MQQFYWLLWLLFHTFHLKSSGLPFLQICCKIWVKEIGENHWLLLEKMVLRSVRLSQSLWLTVLSCFRNILLELMSHHALIKRLPQNTSLYWPPLICHECWEKCAWNFIARGGTADSRLPVWAESSSRKPQQQRSGCWLCSHSLISIL